MKADIGYGPFTYVAGNVGNAGKLAQADSNKQTRLYMKVYFNTRTYKRDSAYPCNTTHTYRQQRAYHEAYYAKVKP